MPEKGDTMKPYFQKNGARHIREMINAAVAVGTRACTVTGNWEMEETVLIPSDFTLRLCDCHLIMADDTFCNMFRNESAGTGKCDRDIVIEGSGRVILDGGNYNGLSEKNSEKDGNPHISVNNILLFVNVEGFKITGLHVRNQRWWALNFLYCRRGLLRDLDFCSDDVWIDGIGQEHHGLRRDNYAAVRVKNSDGIDLRAGCRDILIENITGFTEDDTVALTGLWGTMEQRYYVQDMPTDICNVTVRNVNSAAYCSNVRLLNQSGIRLYNILIDGVMDASLGSEHMDRGGNGVRIGDNHLYGTRHSTKDETFNITVRNVCSRAERVMSLAGAITNLTLDNIRGFDRDGLGDEIDNCAEVY